MLGRGGSRQETNRLLAGAADAAAVTGVRVLSTENVTVRVLSLSAK